MRQPKRLTDKGFKYVHSGDTDIRKTFARVRRELAADAKRVSEAQPAERDCEDLQQPLTGTIRQLRPAKRR